MKVYNPFDQPGTIHRTEVPGGPRATWSQQAAEVRVHFIDDPDSATPARRWPDEPMPACSLGHVAFDPAAYPTIDQAREMLPEYGRLWDAVTADARAARGVPNSREHDEFFALPVRV